MNDVVDAPVERLPSIRIRQNVWIPFTGPTVRGKHNMTCQELTEGAFGMDLGGVAITDAKKGSVHPITIEIINNLRIVTGKQIGRAHV